MQQISIIGNLGADARRQTSNGKEFISFNVAVTEKYTSNGTEVKNTTWYSCTMQNASAKVFDYLWKGQKVYVSGRPVYRLYDSQAHRCKMLDVGIMVNLIELCGSVDDGNRSVEPVSENESGEKEPPF